MQGWVGDAASGDATEAEWAGVLAGLAAFLHASGADLFGAAWGQFRFTEADFARGAGVDACLHLRARAAHGRIIQVRSIAAWLSAVFGAEVHRGARAGQQAATEAVASVGRERSAVILADGGLGGVVVVTALATREVGVGVVGAFGGLR